MAVRGCSFLTLCLAAAVMASATQAFGLFPQFAPKAFRQADPEASSALETFSLSFVGNFNLSNAIEGIRKIFEGISKFIDLNFIHATVDVVVERFFPPAAPDASANEIVSAGSGIAPRRDIVLEDPVQAEALRRKDQLKEEIATVVGAVMNKQQCWERTACMIGRKTNDFAARELFLLLAERVVPAWNETWSLVRTGAESQSCSTFRCAPQAEDN